MKPEEQQRLIHNIVAGMRSVSKEIQLRQIGHFAKADPKYGAAVAQGLGCRGKTRYGGWNGERDAASSGRAIDEGVRRGVPA